MLVCGGIFWKLSADYSAENFATSLRTRCSILFLLGCIFYLPFLMASLGTFPTEKVIYLKESSSRMYSLPCYFLSRNIIEIPLLIIIPFISALIIYWMVEFNQGTSYFFVFVLIAFMCCLCGSSIGLLTGSIFNSIIIAAGVVPSLTIPLMFIGGFLKNRADFSAWYGWLEYLSPFKYAFNAFALNEFRGTAAPVELFNFNLSLWLAIVLLGVISIVARFLGLFILMLKKDRLQ
mgnify:FL=1